MDKKEQKEFINEIEAQASIPKTERELLQLILLVLINLFKKK